MKVVIILWLIGISACTAQNNRRQHTSNRIQRIPYFPLPPVRQSSSGFDEDVLPADDQQFRRPISNSLVTGDDDDRVLVNGVSSRVRSPVFQPFLLEGLSDNQLRFVQRNPQAFVPFYSHNLFNQQSVDNNYLPVEFQGRARRTRTRQRTFTTRRPTQRPLHVINNPTRDFNQMLDAFDYTDDNGFGVDFDFFRDQQSTENANQRPRTRVRSRPRPAPVTRPRIRPVPTARPRQRPTPAFRPRQRPTPAVRPRRRLVPAVQPTQRPISVPRPRPHLVSLPRQRPRTRPATIKRPRVTIAQQTPTSIAQNSRVNVPRPRQRSQVTVQRSRVSVPRHRVNIQQTQITNQRPRVRFVRVEEDQLQIARPPPIDTFAQATDEEHTEGNTNFDQRPSFTIINDAFHFGDILKTNSLEKVQKRKKVEDNTPIVDRQPIADRQPVVGRQPIADRQAIANRQQVVDRQPVAPLPTRRPAARRIDGPRRRIKPRTQIRPTRKPKIALRPVTQAIIPRPPPTTRRPRSRSRFARRRRLRIEANPTEAPTPAQPTYEDRRPISTNTNTAVGSVASASHVGNIPGDTDGDGSPGTAGIDYPIYNKIPETSFSCDNQQSLGYYADPEARCQVFHFCQARGMKTSFLCPNGTIYNQQKLACEWWHNVDCRNSQLHYHVNDRLYKDPSETDDEYV